MRRFAFAVVLVAITFTFAFSDTFPARVVKVEGDTVSYQKGTKDETTKKTTYSDTVLTAKVAKDAKVSTGGKKGGPIEKGFANELFTTIEKGKGVNGKMTIAEEGADKGKITEFVKGGGGKGGK